MSSGPAAGPVRRSREVSRELRQRAGFPSWGLFTDLYQLTMAQGYWQEGLAERRANFQLTMRRAPFGGGFAVFCGLGPALEAIEKLRFEAAELDALAALRDAEGGSLFRDEFLSALGGQRTAVDLWSPDEGEVVLPGEPVVRVEGPLLQGQLLETAMLNLIGYSSLVATKAARIAWLAAEGDPVLDFGLRRAHGPDGGLSMSRAAYVGGCSSTSNVLAGALWGIPTAGTHAHSWVLAHDGELESFRAFARSQPGNCTLLIDTYDTMAGLENALIVAREMRDRGERLRAVRLDSGDLEELSKGVRARLDEAGFEAVRIVASSDLDEHAIVRLKAAGAPISLWGVGTSLAACRDDPSFSGAYKLTSIASSTDESEALWRPVSKRSEDRFKRSDPGRLQVRRSFDGEGRLRQDTVYHLAGDGPTRTGRQRDLLRRQVLQGERRSAAESLGSLRERVRRAVAALPADLRAFDVGAEVLEQRVQFDESLQRLRRAVAPPPS